MTEDKTTKALINLKPKALHFSLLKTIEKVVESHTRGSQKDESRVIYCSSRCLAKDIERHIQPLWENYL